MLGWSAGAWRPSPSARRTSDVAPVAVAAEALQVLTGRYRIDEATVRTLTVMDGRLYAQRGSGSVLPLQQAQQRSEAVWFDLGQWRW